jgi:hypothetical protein
MQRTLREYWDLSLVLEYLSKAPFEPMGQATLRNLTLKTVFLVQLASARRVSWIHNCRIDSAHLQWDDERGVKLLPRLTLDKNQTHSFDPAPVYLPSLKLLSSSDKIHCPVRALRWYTAKTKSYRGQEMSLFIKTKEPYGKAAKATIASWVREVIRESYAQKEGGGCPRTWIPGRTPRGEWLHRGLPSREYRWRR